MSKSQNVLATLNMMRSKGVAAYKNNHGQVVFSGMSNLTKGEKNQLLQFSQQELVTALRWQQA